MNRRTDFGDPWHFRSGKGWGVFKTQFGWAWTSVGCSRGPIVIENSGTSKRAHLEICKKVEKFGKSRIITEEY